MTDRRPRSGGRMLCLLSSVILTTWIGGCATGPSRYLCPTLKTYPKEFMTAAASEPKGPKTKILLSDYGQHRDACRALEASK